VREVVHEHRLAQVDIFYDPQVLDEKSVFSFKAIRPIEDALDESLAVVQEFDDSQSVEGS